MKEKINIIRAILMILLTLQFAIIFNFSNQDGEKSGSLSREITVNVTKDIKSIQKLEQSKKEQVLNQIEHYIRKTAHFSLYTIVGILSMSLMSTYKIKQKNKLAYSLAIGITYAVLDEIHQAFTPDRTPAIGDVCIDTCGVIVGIGIVCLAMYIVKHKGMIKFRK